MCSSQRVPPPQPALLSAAVSFFSAAFNPPVSRTARWFSIPRCLRRNSSHVSLRLCHTAPPPAPRRSPASPSARLPLSPHLRALSCCTSGTSPASAGSPVPSLPLFRVRTKERKRVALAAFTTFINECGSSRWPLQTFLLSWRAAKEAESQRFGFGRALGASDSHPWTITGHSLP